MMISNSELDLLKKVVSLPTAPFAEDAVQKFIKKWAVENDFLIKSDRKGNILLEYPGKGKQKSQPLVLQAHMDHPGFSFLCRKGKKAQAWFMGGVAEQYFAGQTAVFYPENQPSVRAKVQSALKNADTGFTHCKLQLESPVDIPVGTLGMWDLPIWRKSGDTLTLRVADDLVGVASVLITLLRLKSAGSSKRTLGLLTRAEEVGFIGAVAAAKSGLIDKNYPVLGIETSKAQINTPLGSGVVVRVADRISVFEPLLTMGLRNTAERLKNSLSDNFNYTAAVMPGGSTESTMLRLLGYRTCAVCLPLGNYHNMGKNKISGEKINLNDLNSLIFLLTQTACSSDWLSGEKELKKRLTDNYNKKKSFL